MGPRSLRARGRLRAVTPSGVLPLTASKAKALDHGCTLLSTLDPASGVTVVSAVLPDTPPSSPPPRWPPGPASSGAPAGGQTVGGSPHSAGHLLRDRERSLASFPPRFLSRACGGPCPSGGCRFVVRGWVHERRLERCQRVCPASSRGPFRSCPSHRTPTRSFPSSPRTRTRRSNPPRTDRSLPGRS